MAKDKSKEEFQSRAMKLAEKLDIDAHDIIVAYEKKPESLQAIFNKVRKTEGAAGEVFVSCAIISGIAALIVGSAAFSVALPATLLLTVAAAGNSNDVSNTAHQMITAEIEKTKALPPAGGTSGLPALPPPNLS